VTPKCLRSTKTTTGRNWKRCNSFWFAELTTISRVPTLRCCTRFVLPRRLATYKKNPTAALATALRDDTLHASHVAVASTLDPMAWKASNQIPLKDLKARAHVKGERMKDAQRAALSRAPDALPLASFAIDHLNLVREMLLSLQAELAAVRDARLPEIRPVRERIMFLENKARGR
jgi:hypothetical protein